MPCPHKCAPRPPEERGEGCGWAPAGAGRPVVPFPLDAEARGRQTTVVIEQSNVKLPCCSWKIRYFRNKQLKATEWWIQSKNTAENWRKWEYVQYRKGQRFLGLNL